MRNTIAVALLVLAGCGGQDIDESADAGCEVPAEVSACIRTGDPAAKCCLVVPTSCGVCADVVR